MKVDIFQDQIRQETIQGEYNRLKLFIGTLIFGFLLMGFLFFALKNVGSFFKNPLTTTFIMIWIFTFISYEFIMFLIVRWRMKRQKPKLIALKIFNIIVETLLVGFLLFMLCRIESTPVFLDSPLFLFYFILIILSALHLDIGLVLLTSFLSALSYFVVTIWAINTFDLDVLNVIKDFKIRADVENIEIVWRGKSGINEEKSLWEIDN